jgi:hypothetical protein
VLDDVGHNHKAEEEDAHKHVHQEAPEKKIEICANGSAVTA